jgi:hypothetical protein
MGSTRPIIHVRLANVSVLLSSLEHRRDVFSGLHDDLGDILDDDSFLVQGGQVNQEISC